MFSSCLFECWLSRFVIILLSAASYILSELFLLETITMQLMFLEGTYYFGFSCCLWTYSGNWASRVRLSTAFFDMNFGRATQATCASWWPFTMAARSLSCGRWGFRCSEVGRDREKKHMFLYGGWVRLWGISGGEGPGGGTDCNLGLWETCSSWMAPGRQEVGNCRDKYKKGSGEEAEEVPDWYWAGLWDAPSSDRLWRGDSSLCL